LINFLSSLSCRDYRNLRLPDDALLEPGPSASFLPPFCCFFLLSSAFTRDILKVFSLCTSAPPLSPEAQLEEPRSESFLPFPDAFSGDSLSECSSSRVPLPFHLADSSYGFLPEPSSIMLSFTVSLPSVVSMNR